MTKTRQTAVTVIRFSARIARQCSALGSGLPDWIVCDTIANGAKLATGRRGPGGGAVYRFERGYGLRSRRRESGITVRVLAEVAGRGCLALRLLPGPELRKNLGILGIFESRRFKMNASTRSLP